MSAISVILIGVGGGLGAAVRYLVDRAMPLHSWRLGTFTVNCVGSFLLGVATALWAGSEEAQQAQWLAIAGTGFCGGLTTFSTASVDAVELISEHSTRRSIAYQVLMLLSCLTMAALGYFLGSLLANR